MRFCKLLVLNRAHDKSAVSFNVRVPVDVERYEAVAQHHKRRLLAQKIPVVIPHNQSRDVCEITGLTPTQIKDDYEFNKILRAGIVPIEILYDIEYTDGTINSLTTDSSSGPVPGNTYLVGGILGTYLGPAD